MVHLSPEPAGSSTLSPSTPAKGFFGASSRREILSFAGLLAVLLAWNLATAMVYPNVWCDEAMYSSPGINLATGKGFTSGSWYAQTSDQFYAGNTPLHPLIVSLWSRAFGFSPVSMRALSYVGLVLGTFCIWLFCVRTRLLTRFKWHLLFVALLVTDSSMSFSYRSARPDMTTYFLAALSLCAMTIPSASVRYPCLFALGMLFPWAGLQLLPLLAVLAFIVLVLWGWKNALPVVIAGAGAGAGLLALYWFYASHGVWGDFLKSISRHTAGRSTFVEKLGQLPEMFMRDRSAPFVLLLLAALFFHQWLRRRPADRVLLFGLAAGILIPVSLHFTGVFPIYYGWMASVPAGLVLSYALSKYAPAQPGLKWTAIALVACAMVVGLPIRWLGSLQRSGARSCAALDGFIRGQINSTDQVYTEYSAFFSVRSKTENVFTFFYLQAITPAEQAATTALVLNPRNVESLTNTFPGPWIMTAEFQEPPPSTWVPEFVLRHFRSTAIAAIFAPNHLVVYRRSPGH